MPTNAIEDHAIILSQRRDGGKEDFPLRQCSALPKEGNDRTEQPTKFAFNERAEKRDTVQVKNWPPPHSGSYLVHIEPL